LNGANLPKNEEEWCMRHPGRDWNSEREVLLPGYEEVRRREREGGVLLDSSGGVVTVILIPIPHSSSLLSPPSSYSSRNGSLAVP